jgi:hypothetical protein
MTRVRILTGSDLGIVLGHLPGSPRVVVSGNFATPLETLRILDAAVGEYRLFMLNAQAGIPDRDGVILESPFVGPGMRGSKRLQYFPCRLSLVPDLLKDKLSPDVVLVHTSGLVSGTAAIWGHDAAAQARQIIEDVAHPSVRDELREAGRGLGFQLT